MQNIALTATLTLSVVFSTLSALAMDRPGASLAIAAEEIAVRENRAAIEKREQKQTLSKFLFDIQSCLPIQTDQQRRELLDIRKEMVVGLFKDIGLRTKEFLDALSVISPVVTKQKRIELLGILSQIAEGLPTQTDQQRRELSKFLLDIQSCLPIQTDQQRRELLDIRKEMVVGLFKDIGLRTKEFLDFVKGIAATAGD